MNIYSRGVTSSPVLQALCDSAGRSERGVYVGVTVAMDMLWRPSSGSGSPMGILRAVRACQRVLCVHNFRVYMYFRVCEYGLGFIYMGVCAHGLVNLCVGEFIHTSLRMIWVCLP